MEVYTNTSELWGKRQALLKELYASLSDLDSELALHRENEEEELHVHVGERGKVGKEAEGWFSWVFSEPTYVEQEEKEAVGEGGGNSIQGYSDSDDVAVELVNNVEYNIPLSVEQHSLYELFDIYSKSEAQLLLPFYTCTCMYMCMHCTYMYMYVYVFSLILKHIYTRFGVWCHWWFHYPGLLLHTALMVSLFIRCTMRCEIWAQPAELPR